MQTFPCEHAAGLSRFLTHTGENKNGGATWGCHWPVGGRGPVVFIACTFQVVLIHISTHGRIHEVLGIVETTV